MITIIESGSNAWAVAASDGELRIYSREQAGEWNEISLSEDSEQIDDDGSVILEALYGEHVGDEPDAEVDEADGDEEDDEPDAEEEPEAEEDPEEEAEAEEEQPEAEERKPRRRRSTPNASRGRSKAKAK